MGSFFIDKFRYITDFFSLQKPLSHVPLIMSLVKPPEVFVLLISGLIIYYKIRLASKVTNYTVVLHFIIVLVGCEHFFCNDLAMPLSALYYFIIHFNLMPP